LFTGAGAAYVAHRAAPIQVVAGPTQPAPNVTPPVAPEPTHASEARRVHDETVARIRAAAPANVPHATLDASYIRDQMQGLIPLVAECYEEAINRKEGLAGKVVVRFTIVGDPQLGGLVADSQVVDDKSTLNDEEARRCLQESMYAARFPAPAENGEMVVEYPFTLLPDDSVE
jgi:hypothetical protein